MSLQDKRASRSVRIPNKSPIAQPPRAALPGRSPPRPDQQQQQQQQQQQSQSSEAGRSTPDPNARSSSPSKLSPPSHSSSSDAQTQSTTRSSSSPDPASKSARISFLEKDMAVMESEFSRELTQLGQKLSDEAALSQYWQQKHSALHAQFIQVDTDLRLLRHDGAARAQGSEDRERDVKTRIESLRLDRDTMREAFHVAKMELAVREEEVGSLRAQVKGLKDFVSTSSRMDGQVTDEAFGELMQRLGNGLQNWVIQNFRKAKIDMSKSSPHTRTQLLELIPTYASYSHTPKIHLIQSLISRLIATHILDAYFVGLPDTRATELRAMETYFNSLIPTTSSFSSSSSSSLANNFRSSTLGLLHRKEVLEKLSPATDALISRLITRINALLDDISDAKSSPTRDSGLRSLLTQSIDLSRLFRVQKAVFRTIMPVIEGHQINSFDGALMEDVSGLEEDDDEGLTGRREICCVVFFGVVKEGDEAGGEMQLRNVVGKARVLCQPG